MKLCTMLILITIFGCSSSQHLEVEYEISKTDRINGVHAFSVSTLELESFELLIPFWHTKAKELCGHSHYHNASLMKHNRECGDAHSMANGELECEVIPASIFGILNCNGI